MLVVNMEKVRLGLFQLSTNCRQLKLMTFKNHKIMKRILLLCLFFLSSCSSSKNKIQEESSVLVDLVESTQIIRTLISSNKVGVLLEAHDDEQLSLLLNNFSPAQLAFESEVASCTIPCIMLYYFKDSPQEREFIDQLKKLARKYDDQVKFVIIDTDKLFSLAREAEIDAVPTVVFIQNNNIVFNRAGAITVDFLEDCLKSELDKEIS